MDWKLALVLIPVSDVDRAKEFYVEKMAFHLDVDHQPNDDFRIVQVTPSGSACSIGFGIGINASEPGSTKGLHLCVADIEAARGELTGRGVEISEPYHFGMQGRADGIDPNRGDYATFCNFDDPDGNTWVLQEVGHAAAESD